MNILALDTATLDGSAAVISDGQVLAECSARIRATHSEQVLGLVADVLSRAGLRPADLDLLAVGIGPGSFTGVRIGMATARGLRLATDCSLVGVSSLDALAASAWGATGFVLAALDARRGEVYAGGWSVHHGARSPVLAPCHGGFVSVGRAALTAADGGLVVTLSDLPPGSYEQLVSVAPERFVRAPRPACVPLARYVAWEALAGRGVVDDGSLEPMYLRPHDAKLPGGSGVP